jgi:hypothetical protein
VPSTAAREKVAFAKARCHKFHRWPVLLRDAMRMSDDENKDEGILAPTEDNYEAIASQEELYLEEAEENLRAILTSNKRLPSRTAESLNEQLDHAAEELITGAADDARLSEEAVADVLRMTLNAPRFDGCDR